MVDQSNQEFYKYNGRLALFRTGSVDTAAWEERWSITNHQEILHHYESGQLDEFGIFGKYLPKHLPVLEAGCGLGQLVVALNARGYTVEGIDYAEQTIARIQEIKPSLKVRVGDIYHIDKPDQYYGGYISMGVLEHNPEGPSAGLLEARRVLNNAGVAFITVPYLTKNRNKVLNSIEASDVSTRDNGLNFYQYYFSLQEFANFLNQSGFTILEIYPYAVFAGLTRDFKLGKWLHERHFFHWRIQRLVADICAHVPRWLRFKYGHMAMFVCRPI